jgi:hypothetical protein
VLLYTKLKFVDKCRMEVVQRSKIVRVNSGVRVRVRVSILTLN